MAYLQLIFEATGAQAEALADALFAAGAISVDISDPRAGDPDEAPIYDEPGLPAAQAWPDQRLTALFAGDADPAGVLAEASTAFGEPVPAPAAAGRIEEQDWVRRSQEQFNPVRVDGRLWIVPSWCKAPEDAAVVIVLDPGLAFGTGSHPTTRLCLRWLSATITGGERVLDYGCGSGVLAIAAMKLGASSAIGVDVDEEAIAASRFNAGRNAVAARFGPPEDAGGTPADVVVANILANPLRLLAPILAANTRAGGRLLLSGLLAHQADELSAVYAPWFTMRCQAIDDGWAALEGLRLDTHFGERGRPPSTD